MSSTQTCIGAFWASGFSQAQLCVPTALHSALSASSLATAAVLNLLGLRSLPSHFEFGPATPIAPLAQGTPFEAPREVGFSRASGWPLKAPLMVAGLETVSPEVVPRV